MVTTAASKALDAMGIGHDISEEAKCCGSPLLKIGAREEAEELRRNNMKVFSGYEQIVTSCPGCTYQLRQEYGIEAKHVVEIMTKGRWRSAVEGRWALQIPCHLKRGVSPWAAETMVTLLQEAGVELVRLPEEDSCCGGGGGLLAGFPEASSSLAASKADLYRKAEVKGVITACPFCSLNLRKAGLLVLDITEALIARD
jgi:Fe-S oxidoreductase